MVKSVQKSFLTKLLNLLRAGTRENLWQFSVEPFEPGPPHI